MFLLSIVSFNVFNQIPRATIVNGLDKKFNKKTTFAQRKTTIINGNGKSGNNTIFYSFITADKNYAKDYTVVVKGDFNKKKINGQAEVAFLLGLNYDHLIESLKNYSGSLKSFLNKNNIRAYEYYEGDFDNSVVRKGHFQYSGETKIAYPYFVKHLQEVFPVNDNLDFEYNYYGMYERDDYDERYKMSESDSIVIIDFKSDKKYIIKSIFNDLIFKKDIYQHNDYLGSEIFNANEVNSVGWRTKLYDSTISVFLEGATRNYNDIPEHFIDFNKKSTYKKGDFYGEMLNGKPQGYGIFINEDYFYQGFFNNGKFEGYGFYQHLKPHPKIENSCISATCLGLFNDNKIVSGEVMYNWLGSSWVLAGDSIYQDYNFPVELTNETEEPLFDRFKLAGFKIYGNGEMIEKDRYIGGGGWFEEKTYQKGNFNANKLNGYGCKLFVKTFEKDETICTNYENGELSKAYKDSILIEYKKYRKLKRDSLWAEAVFKPGTIIKKNNSYYYVNEILRKGYGKVLYVPIYKPAVKDGFFKRGMEPQVFYSVYNELLGTPYFGNGFYPMRENMHEYESTNLKLCNRCSGYGVVTKTYMRTGSSTDKTTRKVVTHDGDYYRVTKDVTTYTTRNYTYPEKVKETCETCHGKGCVVK